MFEVIEEFKTFIRSSIKDCKMMAKVRIAKCMSRYQNDQIIWNYNNDFKQFS